MLLKSPRGHGHSWISTNQQVKHIHDQTGMKPQVKMQ
jgi:hypothetical protein